jgi:hypothetical protein
VTSNETISQLQKQLKQRSKLVHTIVNLESEQLEEQERQQNGPDRKWVDREGKIFK